MDLINSLLKLLNSDSTLSAWRPRHYIPILRQPAAQRPEQQMTKSIVTGARGRDENILYIKVAAARTHKPIYLFIINALSIAAQFFAARSSALIKAAHNETRAFPGIKVVCCSAARRHWCSQTAACPLAGVPFIVSARFPFQLNLLSTCTHALALNHFPYRTIRECR